MIGRISRPLAIIVALVALAAVALALSTLLSMRQTERELLDLRDAVARAQDRDEDTALQLVPMAERLESLATQLTGQAQALDAFRALEARVAEVEERTNSLEMASAAVEAAAAEPEALLVGEVVDAGVFTVLRAGIPMGREAYEVRREGQRTVLFVDAVRADGLTETHRTYVVAYGEHLVPSEIRDRTTRGETLDRAEARVDGAIVRLSSSGGPALPFDLEGRQPAALDPELSAPFALLERALGDEGDLQTGSQIAGVVLREADATAIEAHGTRPATLESPAVRSTALRREVTLGEEAWVVYSYEGNVIAVERPSREEFAYRSDLFPGGLSLWERTFANLALPPGVREEETTFVNAGHSLHGVFTFSSLSSSLVPIVLLLPDLGPFDRNGDACGLRAQISRLLAHQLALAGIASFRYDMRGVGSSGGSYAATSLADLASDARVALVWMRTLPIVDPDKVFVLGLGLGGLVAAQVAASPSVRGVIALETPARGLTQLSVEELRWRGRAAGLLEAEIEILVEREQQFLGFAGATRGTWADVGFEVAHAALPWLTEADFARRSGFLSLPLLRDLAATDPLEAFSEIAKPVLLVQGDKNPNVFPEDAVRVRQAAVAAGNGQVSVSILTDMNALLRPHSGAATQADRGLAGELDLRLVELLIDWIGPSGDVLPGGSGTPSSRS
ncbi:MAG: alpha/beta hydrolase [Candidatus Bipolaricaulota bacterium]